MYVEQQFLTRDAL